ncbi:MAG: hypothetical protein RI964_26 [Pseudomonadota bacterium]|jgi:hypothetical protein
MKFIKFDLPIDGIKVCNIEQLCHHFTPEIIDLYKSGLLAKWLRAQELTHYLNEIEIIDASTSDQECSDLLCKIFSINKNFDLSKSIGFVDELNDDLRNIMKKVSAFDWLSSMFK